MAGACDKLNIFIVLFINFNLIFLNINAYVQQDIYNYKVETNLPNVNADTVFIRPKRDTTSSYQNIPSITGNISITEGQGATVISKTVPDNVSTDATNSSDLKNSTINANFKVDAKSIDLGRPLLGVNGTGQRKDYSISTSQVISEPIDSANKTNDSNLFDDIFNTVDVSDNETRTEISNRNFTYKQENHIYYNSTQVIDPVAVEKSWKEVNKINPNHMLSTSHRRAITVQLKFDFPFYGHPVRNITVATGGFLYTGEYVHSWLAATQYIAPLMANFDTSLSNDSYVKYDDNGTSFTVLWENVSLQDRPEAGKFTFSATLHESGDIEFTYYQMPIKIYSIQDDKHPVKVGLSDAYIIDKVIFFARRKTIYEYHRVNFNEQDIQNNTIIYLKALPTCLLYTDCHSCTANQNTSFVCTWCPGLNKCSTGADRKRQDWVQKGCERNLVKSPHQCPSKGGKGNDASSSIEINQKDKNQNNMGSKYDTLNNHDYVNQSDNKNLAVDGKMSKEGEDRNNVGLALGLMIPICLVLTILVWMLYAYRNPHTKSGQLLIQYRPTQWSWRRGEARYTAATIHM